MRPLEERGGFGVRVHRPRPLARDPCVAPRLRMTLRLEEMHREQRGLRPPRPRPSACSSAVAGAAVQLAALAEGQRLVRPRRA